jgi:environmental stress-induced protein Ves
MKAKIVSKEDFITTKWAGGETTQLAIYPENSVFAERDFLWRISSATFTATDSTFSDFTGYQRYILPLKGELNIYHKGLYDRHLKPYEVEYFDGAWATRSTNSPDCRDFNFIVESGSLARLQVLLEGEEYFVRESAIAAFFSMDDFEIEHISFGDKISLGGFSLYVLETDSEEQIRIFNARSPVIVAEYILK